MGFDSGYGPELNRAPNKRQRANVRWPITVTATANYSQHKRIDHNDNKNLTSKSNSPQHKQDAHSTKENSHSTNENFQSTNQNLTAPRDRGSLLCLFLNLKK